jgi:uncharacterized protein (TIGR02466 family)
VQITNQGGWHSQTNLLENPALASLFQWIAGCCQEAFTDLGWDFSLAHPRFNNAWAMLNSSGHSVRAHVHPNSLFSGVAYLQANPTSGSIGFLDPRNGAQVLAPPLLAKNSGILKGRHEEAPASGRLLLFPAWLWHEVDINCSNAERVCISFNVGMNRQQSNSNSQAKNTKAQIVRRSLTDI